VRLSPLEAPLSMTILTLEQPRTSCSDRRRLTVFTPGMFPAIFSFPAVAKRKPWDHNRSGSERCIAFKI
jgi:hypothetical protein